MTFHTLKVMFLLLHLHTFRLTLNPPKSSLPHLLLHLLILPSFHPEIRALSNQKYREFKEEFSDVGLMTGDVTIDPDPNASCLVMTTEIWRSMQYKGSEVVREVAWVVFDEVHYMRDRERGVVWEQSIVMAPKNSRFVFLSATVPNVKEFADWVAKVHK
ncbi:hypothetical protein V6N13_078333 [Hibiscus sabdariffa]